MTPLNAGLSKGVLFDPLEPGLSTAIGDFCLTVLKPGLSRGFQFDPLKPELSRGFLYDPTEARIK